MPTQSAELKVTDQPNCPTGQELCGFTEGMDVIIFDNSGNFDTFTITQVQDDAAHLQHRGQDLNYAVRRRRVGHAGRQQHVSTWIAATNQLMQYNGGHRRRPLVDNVVDLQVQLLRRSESADAAEAAAG